MQAYSGKFVVRCLVLIFACLVPAALGAQERRSLTVVNQQDAAINEIYVNPVGSNHWGRDLLGDNIIVGNGSARIAVSSGRSGCLVDVRIVRADGRSIERRDFDACANERIVLADDTLLTEAEARARVVARLARLAEQHGAIMAAQSRIVTEATNPFGGSTVASEFRGLSSALQRVQEEQFSWAAREAQLGDSQPTRDPRITEFLFATNRARAAVAQRVDFGFARANELTLGAARIRVPRHHVVGRLELPNPGWTLFGITFGAESLDPEKHFQIVSTTSLTRERWLEVAKLTSSNSEALVFVHGFNVDFNEALYRTSQVMYDLQYKGLVVMFSWPSKGGVLDYRYDIDSATHARRHFLEVLRVLQVEAGIQKVNVLAHSMGNAVVIDALSGQAAMPNPRSINELIMAAPDVDRDIFAQSVASLRLVTRGMTLYASSTDRAITVSRGLAGAPRAGDIDGGRPIMAAGVDSIDVSVLGNEILGLNHSTFAERRALMNDIRLLLSQNIRPPSARLSEIRGVPDNGAARPDFWRFTD